MLRDKIFLNIDYIQAPKIRFSLKIFKYITINEEKHYSNIKKLTVLKIRKLPVPNITYINKSVLIKYDI